MKQQRWSLLISAACSIFSLGMYFIGAFACVNGGDLVKDIFIAIFSSSIFVVVLSAIGYMFEKKRLIENIYKSYLSYGIGTIYNVADRKEEKLQLKAKDRSIFLTNIMTNLKSIKYFMEEYYLGCFRKDKELELIVNKRLFPFYNYLAEMYNKSVIKDDGAAFNQQLEVMLKIYRDFSAVVETWLNSKRRKKIKSKQETIERDKTSKQSKKQQQ